MFWLIITVMIVIGLACMSSNDVYYVRQTDDVIGVLIIGVAVGASIIHLANGG